MQPSFLRKTLTNFKMADRAPELATAGTTNMATGAMGGSFELVVGAGHRSRRKLSVGYEGTDSNKDKQANEFR